MSCALKKYLFGFGIMILFGVSTITLLSQNRGSGLPIQAGLMDSVEEMFAPFFDGLKTTMVKYEMSSMARTISAKAFGKNIIPTPGNFRQYLRDSMTSSKDASLDMWGTPYSFDRKGKAGYIISAGPDKKKGTADDLRQEVSLP
jgi:hypothetical protein